MATYTPTSSSGTTYSSLSVGDIIQGNYTGNMIPVTIPAGSYKLECYGAQGGSGRTLTRSTSSTSGSYECPSSSDFTVVDVYGGNASIYNSSYYLMYLGQGQLNHSEIGTLNVQVNTSGTYKFVITYQTEKNCDTFSISIGETNYYNSVSGDNTSSPDEYELSLSSGQYISMEYRKDGSVNTGSDYVGIEIYKYVDGSSESWSFGSLASGGYGGYSQGILNLTSATTLYLCPGGMGGFDSQTSGTPSQQTISGGWNGGGSAHTYVYGDAGTMAGGGGGASDIRIGSNSLYARVIVAGGGGGSAGVSDTTKKRGGGSTGSSSGGSSYYGTQTAAGTGGDFGTGGNATGSNNYKYGAGGGGGGWYGGGASTNVSDTDTNYRTYNGGGSGYVYTSSTASNYPSGCLLNSNYYLTDATTTTNTRTRNGLVKITMLAKAVTYKMWVKTATSTWSPANKVYVKTAASTWKEGSL